MDEPVLVILAAGMGSRYGGLKQMDPIDFDGHVIMDYSIYDAIEAGFKNIMFIIKKQIEKDFKDIIGKRIEKIANVKYIYQEIDTLPEGYEVPKDRVKPWGTAHAILQLKNNIDVPFAIINADDYYGKEGFKKLYKFLKNDVTQNNYCMIAYELKNTISENGHVARGVCEVKDGKLVNIVETKKIESKNDGIYFTEDEGKTWKKLDNDTLVSMNMWGFHHTLIEKIDEKFVEFLDINLKKDPLKSEYLLPEIIEMYLKSKEIEVSVDTSADKWYGVTYKEDKEDVVKSLKKLRENGLYKFS